MCNRTTAISAGRAALGRVISKQRVEVERIGQEEVANVRPAHRKRGQVHSRAALKSN